MRNFRSRRELQAQARGYSVCDVGQEHPGSMLLNEYMSVPKGTKVIQEDMNYPDISYGIATPVEVSRAQEAISKIHVVISVFL